MKKIMLCTMMIGALSFTSTRAEESLNDAFVSLYAMIGDTNITQGAFLDGVSDGCSDWFRRYEYARPRINDQSLREWFCMMAESSATNVAEYLSRSCWLSAKTLAISCIALDNAVRGDTNCWFAVAREYGRVRMGLHTDAELDVMRGAVSRLVDGNGVVIVAVPDISSEESNRRRVEVNHLAQMESLDKDFLFGISSVFTAFVTSDTLAAFSVVTRNSIVSNLVETARLTSAEAAALGLTNVVEVLAK